MRGASFFSFTVGGADFEIPALFFAGEAFAGEAFGGFGAFFLIAPLRPLLFLLAIVDLLGGAVEGQVNKEAN